VGGFEFVRLNHGTHPKETGITGSVGPGIDGVDESFFLAHLLEQTRAAARTEQCRQHIEQRHIRMAQVGNVPAKMKMA